MQLCCESIFVLNEGWFGAENDRAGVTEVNEGSSAVGAWFVDEAV